MNSQILTQGRPAVAALFLVMSATAAFAQSNIVRFEGTFDGKSTGAVQGGALLANLNVTGIASYIGRFTITSKDTVDLATGLSSGGVVQLASANPKFFSSDTINGTSVGRGGGPTDTPNVSRTVILVTIIGGTGRFQGATGTITMDFLADNSTIPAYVSTSGKVEGTISIPSSTK